MGDLLDTYIMRLSHTLVLHFSLLQCDHRLAIVYRKFNQRINIELVPRPDTRFAHQSFHGARHFTLLDLNSIYHKFPRGEI